eukprot:m.12741 g.12741  ORF g.12741 m.12741 type:complete len:257 (-) comp10020_c0_seq1:216-986(-)
MSSGLGHRSRSWLRALQAARPGISPMLLLQDKELLCSRERLELIQHVASRRLQGLACVVEGLYDVGNMAAVQRTCDALGIHRCDIANPSRHSKENHRGVSKGSDKWLSQDVFQTPTACAQYYKQQGFTIAAATLATDTIPLDQLNAGQDKLCLVFGNEAEGVSDEMVALADVNFQIPMHGFVESLNVSVAAGVALHTAATQRRRAIASISDQSALEQAELELEYTLRSAFQVWSGDLKDVTLRRLGNRLDELAAGQ